MGFEGRRQLSGVWGQLWLNNELIDEISEFETKITIQREDVPLYGGDTDSKMVGRKGEGSMTLKKAFTRADIILEAIQKGVDLRFKIVGKIKDPDAYGKQTERVSISNVWFNEFTLMQFAQGTIEDNLPFGYTVDSVEYLDKIKK